MDDCEVVDTEVEVSEKVVSVLLLVSLLVVKVLSVDVLVPLVVLRLDVAEVVVFTEHISHDVSHMCAWPHEWQNMVSHGLLFCRISWGQVSQQSGYMVHVDSVSVDVTVVEDAVLVLVSVCVVELVPLVELEVCVVVHTGAARGWSKQYDQSSWPRVLINDTWRSPSSPIKRRSAPCEVGK